MTWEAFLVAPGWIALVAAIALVLAMWTALAFVVIGVIEDQLTAR